MDLETIASAARDVPFMPPRRGAEIYRFVLEHRFQRCLELGVAHGVSTAYIAGALHELGRGRLTAVDKLPPRTDPTVHDLLRRLRLEDYVDVRFEQRSYTWFLMRHLEQSPIPLFDFCFLDGAHTWDVDGFAFLLVDRILRPGGWILLDDLDWCIANSPTLKDAEWVQRLPREERETCQLRKVWDILITRHPDYDLFRDDGRWGYARKSATAGTSGMAKSFAATALPGATDSRSP